MSVYDFCSIAIDDSAECSIFDLNDEVMDEVFSGSLREASSSGFEDYELWSFELDNGIIVLGIMT